MSTQRGRRHSLLLRVLRAAAATAACVTAAAGPAPAQPARADYERALGLREAYQKAAVGIAGPATWIGKTGRFWYRRSVEGGHEFLVVDAATRARERAFDHDAVAAALGRATGGRYTGVTLPFQRIEFAEDGRRLEVRVEGTLYRCALAEPVSCEKVEPPAGAWGGPGFSCVASTADRPLVSPDGAWEAFVQNYNVAVRPRPAKEAPKTPDTVTLSTDGSEGQCYAPRSIVWSPDSTRIAAYRVTPGHRREVHYIESSPEDQLQPKHSTRFYAKPGDVLDIERPVLFHVPTARRIDVDSALFPHAFDMSPLVWRKDGRAVTFEYNQRGHQVYRVIEVSAETGAARAVVDERAATFFNYSGKKFRHDVDDGREVVWMSERDGWNHLYLYDGATGTVRQQITSGSWPVREVLKVDEQARRIWFTASGVRDGVDPYFLDAYRIDFDGGHLVRLTEGDLNHAVSLSDDGQWLVDTASRVDVAPTMTLRRGEDGEAVAELERGDLGPLRRAGWRPPEVFVAKGRDGATDIWGVIYRPSTYDAAKQYPVIENIYAGPQSAFVPKSFSAYNPMQAQAELGFIVVQIDGMGTAHRSKAFHDVAWKNLKDAGLPDRILWHQAQARRDPSYDITRVGIYGTSAGGQSSLGALLFHPEFYKVAVSAVGCHDNRMDKIWWNEQWMGWPIGPHYAESSNVVNASRLEGRVLLVVGELDTNVDPSSTMQVANALIKANKTFDLLVIPGAGHGPGGAYGERKRFDFFVQHLLGAVPPDWNSAP
ncbi:MAG: prolyl oligopeptidase family serine peptidase [Vicinamibacteraceae bacterium]|nr:prolyl oligopeptidase family serine peptidase [Vicinamibacteraceae bacterium]